MAKLIVQLVKKKLVDGKERVLQEYKEYIVNDTSRDFNTHAGTMPKAEFLKPDGSIIKTNSGSEFILLPCLFSDSLSHIKKLPQTVMAKDIGLIISTTGVGTDSIVLDAGTGSGALALGLARVCKEVHTYELRDDFIENIKDNIKRCNINNIALHNADVINAVEQNVDLITLDMPDPSAVIPKISKLLKVGHYIVCYLPSITQVMSAVECLNQNNFLITSTTELIKREWIVEGRKVRPDTDMIGHTAFLVFARRMA